MERRRKRGEVNRGRAIYLCLCRGDWLPAVVARDHGDFLPFLIELMRLLAWEGARYPSFLNFASEGIGTVRFHTSPGT
jgi:hypothetical protein